MLCSSISPRLATLWKRLRFTTRLSSKLPQAPAMTDLKDAGSFTEARQWIELFRKTPIARGDVELTFARSSGPGGQNVNKVNTKAIVRCALASAWIPPWARACLRDHPSYAKSGDSILLSSTKHRTQSENVADCLAKLHGLILDVASSQIRTEPSEEQQAKVKRLEKVHLNRMKKEKQHRSSVKGSRRSNIE